MRRTRLCRTFPLSEFKSQKLESVAVGPPERPSSSRPPSSATDQKRKRRESPSARTVQRLEPLHHARCAAPATAGACPRRFSRSARRRRSPGYPLSVSTHRAAAQPPCLTAFFSQSDTSSVTYCDRPDALIVQASRLPRSAAQACPDPNKSSHSTGIRCNIFPRKFINQVCYFRNLNTRRYQCHRQYPRQRIRRTADILHLLFMRGARRCALSFAKVQFHRWVRFQNCGYCLGILPPEQRATFCRCHQHSGSKSRQ